MVTGVGACRRAVVRRRGNVSSRSVSTQNVPAAMRKVRQMRMPAQSASDERHRAQQKTDGETS